MHLFLPREGAILLHVICSRPPPPPPSPLVGGGTHSFPCFCFPTLASSVHAMPACRAAKSMPLTQLGDDCFSPELRAFWASLSTEERQTLLRVPKTDLFKRVTAISCGRCYGLFALRCAPGAPDQEQGGFL